VGISLTERIESLKAGTLAAISFMLAYSIAMLFNSLILAVRFEKLALLQAEIEINLLVKVAIALLSGFLFGVTYRYIVRSDRNSHLKDGAVLAFSLVRGFAPVEVSDNLMQNAWVLSVVGFESIFCFAIARFILDLALDRYWIKPFS
jgi:cellobiose-specific phosphotransferase system component IIC